MPKRPVPPLSPPTLSTALPSPTALTSRSSPTAPALVTALSSAAGLSAPAIGASFYAEYGRGAAPVAARSSLVFVIMSLQREGKTAYAAIQEECQKLQLDVRRSDDGVGSNPVMPEIAKQIREAGFIICDLTHERPNVYYELGYAHGVGNNGDNIILIAKAGTRLHFDIASLTVQNYSSTQSLRDLLARNLRAMLDARRQAAPPS